MVVLGEVKKGRMAEAGRLMGLSYGQARRVWQRFKKAGDTALVHRSRSRAGGRRKDAKLRQRVLARYAVRYPDFAPTLAAEKLVDEGLGVDHETLRRWLIKGGRWQPGAKAASSSGLAGTQGELWADGADGRLAARLV